MRFHTCLLAIKTLCHTIFSNWKFIKWTLGRCKFSRDISFFQLYYIEWINFTEWMNCLYAMCVLLCTSIQLPKWRFLFLYQKKIMFTVYRFIFKFEVRNNFNCAYEFGYSFHYVFFLSLLLRSSAIERWKKVFFFIDWHTKLTWVKIQCINNISIWNG